MPKSQSTGPARKPARKAPARPPRRRTTRSEPADETAALVARVSRAVERELAQIETMIGGSGTDAERRARTLASLARTIGEVARLRTRDADGKDRSDAPDDDAVPRDLEEFRRELSRRLERMVAGRAPVSPSGDEPG